MEAIIYLRDKRIDKKEKSEEYTTLDDSTTTDLGINEDLEADLDILIEAGETEAATEEEDPWAEALAEQNETENKP